MMPSAVADTAFRLLLIDDDPVEGELMQSYLGLATTGPVNFHQVLDVQGGLRHMAENGAADLLLLDNRLHPDESFAQSVAALRDGGYDGPIILFTQHDAEEVAELGLNAHADGYLWKGDLTAEALTRLLKTRMAQAS